MRASQYQGGYDEYGKLLRFVGETRHQSCLMLTSREKPREVALLEGNSSAVRSYPLIGLKAPEGQKILQDKGLYGGEQDWEILVNHYSGNPLALKLVSQFIQEVFDGAIASFLAEGEKFFSDVRDILDQQFGRLSPLEQEIMYWLAIEREATSLDMLQKNIIHPVSMQELQEARRSLRRRCLVETNASGITLQQVILEYITDRLIQQI